jgi:hypothetical protein
MLDETAARASGDLALNVANPDREGDAVVAASGPG